MISPWYPHILMILLYLYILIISHKLGTTTNQLGVLRGPPRLLAGCRQPASDHWRILHPLSRVAEDVLIIYIYIIYLYCWDHHLPLIWGRTWNVFFLCVLPVLSVSNIFPGALLWVENGRHPSEVLQWLLQRNHHRCAPFNEIGSYGGIPHDKGGSTW